MSRIWLLSPIALLAGCKPEAPTGPPERTLAEASEIALGHFRRQDGFSLAGRSEAIVASRPAVRLEVTYLYEGEEL